MQKKFERFVCASDMTANSRIVIAIDRIVWGERYGERYTHIRRDVTFRWFQRVEIAIHFIENPMETTIEGIV